jgi:hypothetical protein
LRKVTDLQRVAIRTTVTDEAYTLAKDATYNIWSQVLDLGENWAEASFAEAENSTVESWKGLGESMYASAAPTTSLIYDANKVRQTAIGWSNVTSLAASAVAVYVSATRPRPLALPSFFGSVETEAIDFCHNKDIYIEAVFFYSAIVSTFRNVKNIAVAVSRDHEIEGLEKVRFRVTVADDIKNIVADDRKFRKQIQGTCSPEILSNFVVTLEVG